MSASNICIIGCLSEVCESAINSLSVGCFQRFFHRFLPPGKPEPAGNYSARSSVAPRPRCLDDGSGGRYVLEDEGNS